MIEEQLMRQAVIAGGVLPKRGGTLSSMIRRTMNLVLAVTALIGVAASPSAQRPNP